MYAKTRKRIAVETTLFIIAGTILQSIFVGLLLKPNEIGSGGIVGITLIVNELFNTPIGFTQLVLNIPLFIVGIKYLGKRFILMTGLVVVLSSILIDTLPVLIPPTPLDDPLVAVIRRRFDRRTRHSRESHLYEQPELITPENLFDTRYHRLYPRVHHVRH